MIIPQRNTSAIDSAVLSYVINVDSEPIIMPTSKAINIVPAPTPRLLMCDKSAVQANRVGLDIPVATPKSNAEMVYISMLFEWPIKSMEIINTEHPINMVFLLPILSEREPVNNRIKIVDRIYIPKNHPLFEIPR